MANHTKINYLNSKIKEVSKEDLEKALKKIREENKGIRDSYKTDKNTMSFRTGR